MKKKQWTLFGLLAVSTMLASCGMKVASSSVKEENPISMKPTTDKPNQTTVKNTSIKKTSETPESPIEENPTVFLEKKETTTDTSLEFITTISNLKEYSNFEKIKVTYTFYRYDSGLFTQMDSSSILYSELSSKAKKEGTYYSSFTISNLDDYSDTTITAQTEVVLKNGKSYFSNEVSYILNEVEDSFFVGMDSSAVPSLEASGISYKDFEGNETDVFKTLADNGINLIRVRVWNDPYDKNGNPYGGGNCDLENCIEIGKRANKYGMKLLVNFQYSDFWADPEKQLVPKAWEGYSLKSKKDAIYTYTLESLNRLKEEGIQVAMVQVGNETNGRFCGEECNDGTMNNVCSLLSSGIAAVRSVYPNALVAVHFANPASGTYPWYASELNKNNVDYDVFGSSYYPYWHGTKDNLSKVLSNIATTYNKKVMIMETSYANSNGSGSDYDNYPNTIYTKEYAESAYGENAELEYPFTVEGQKNQMLAIFDTIMNKTTNGIGACYWEGTWVAPDGGSDSNTEKLWELYGSGWKTKYAYSYNSIYETGNGGCVIENEAFFDKNGNPRESLKVFKTAREQEYKQTKEFTNGTFDSLNGWTLTENKALDTKEITIDSYSTNATNVFKFWSEGEVDFELSQEIKGYSGSYTFSISIEGGKATGTLYAFVRVNGVETKAIGALNGYDDWQTLKVEVSNVKETDTIVVGIVVQYPSNSWGAIDNATFEKN